MKTPFQLRGSLRKCNIVMNIFLKTQYLGPITIIDRFQLICLVGNENVLEQYKTRQLIV